MSKKFTIFGNPVKHSISPKMHGFAIDGFDLDASYSKTLVEDGSKIKEIFLKEFDGANVTVPHKEIAYKLCDEVRGVAKQIGAVNTLVKEDGKMIGYNTDASGFYESIKEFDDIKDVLILGAGGTSKAISLYLKNKGYNITVLNRSQKRLDSFSNFDTFCWDDFKPNKYDMIINTTSAGLADNNYPTPKEILKSIFKDAKVAVDVIYNKNTPFLSLAKEIGIKTKDGSDMLLYQGVKAFNLFYGGKFDEAEITTFMRKAFS